MKQVPAKKKEEKQREETGTRRTNRNQNKVRKSETLMTEAQSRSPAARNISRRKNSHFRVSRNSCVTIKNFGQYNCVGGRFE
jgi:hypothetical protein